MDRLLLGLIFLLSIALSSTPLRATTYDYAGQPLTLTPPVYEYGCSPSCTINGLTGYVSFASDTSAFTGTLTLSSVDTAGLSGYIPGTFIFPSFSYPFNNLRPERPARHPTYRRRSHS